MGYPFCLMKYLGVLVDNSLKLRLTVKKFFFIHWKEKMSYLIFCSFEVGGQPFKIAEALNRNGIETYYISLVNSTGHDSAKFHFGERSDPWNLSYMFHDRHVLSPSGIIKRLQEIKNVYKISNCFATGTKSYLLSDAGMKYHYWCHGADLDQQCFRRVLPSNYPLWKSCIKYLFFICKERREARASICRAEKVMIAPYQKDALKKLCMHKKLFFIPHMFNVDNYEIVNTKKEENRITISRDIKAKRFFFSSVRHVWSGDFKHETDNKGNDVILFSFKKYLEITADYASKLVLVEKGPDVEDSKALARELCIEKNIIWVNEMKREELDGFYQGAIACFGQFGTPVLTYASLEPLANGTVCISYYEKNTVGVPFYTDMPPIFNSKDSDDMACFMGKLKDCAYSDELSYKSWCWAKNNCSEEKFIESFVKSFD